MTLARSFPARQQSLQKGDDGYIARMNTVYEKRAMEFTLIADEDLSKVETISFSPVYTTGEKMAKAGMNTLMGMGVVFAVLIFISWLISMFKYISVFEAKMKAKKNAAAAAPVAAPAAPALQQHRLRQQLRLRRRTLPMIQNSFP